MNTKLLSFLLLFITYSSICAQSQYEISFTYDTAGNQTNRDRVCVNCQTSARSAEAVEEDVLSEQAISEEILEKNNIQNVIVAYPNPVTSILNVDWENNQRKVKEIKLLSLDRRLLYQQTINKNQGTLQIDFSLFPIGAYILFATYTDNSIQSFTIIKK